MHDLDDPELLAGLDRLIRTARYSAGYALKLQRDRIAAVFDAMHDPYMRSRREDLDHVIGRVYAALHRDGAVAPDSSGMAGEVLVCDTVAPAEWRNWWKRRSGNHRGKRAARFAQRILARSLHIPWWWCARALQHGNEANQLTAARRSCRTRARRQGFRTRSAANSASNGLVRLRAHRRAHDGVEINSRNAERAGRASLTFGAPEGSYRTESCSEAARVADRRRQSRVSRSCSA